MKIAFINGSPKAKNSSSESVLSVLKPMLIDKNEIIDYNLRTSTLSNEEIKSIGECSILIFAFPLYVDAVPSHLISCLYEMEMFFKEQLTKDKMVYALGNCGFYEGNQNTIALDIVKNWSIKAGLKWGQGIGIGGGGMLPMLKSVPDGKGPKKNLSKALKIMANNITNRNTDENIFINPNIPKFIYKLGAESDWRQQIKENGLKKKDIFRRK